MIKMRLIALVLLISGSFGQVFAQITTQEIDRLVERAMDTFQVAGVAVGLVQNGKIIHAKGYGVQSVKTLEPVSEQTQFAIASNTKAFTTAALALLVEEGKITWTDRVKDHLPEFTMYNNYVTENFNVQDLLTHRSGLGLGAGDLMFIPGGSDFTIEDILTSFQYFKPVSAFRTQYDYDNLLYMVAGELIARVSGMSWEAFINQRILNPLDMDHSFASLEDITDTKDLSEPHREEDGALRTLTHHRERINGAAGGIYATVNDLCQWMLVQLNEGRYGKDLEQHLFSEENQRQMWKIHTTLNAPRSPRFTSHFSGYGLGWNLLDMNGQLLVHHGGFITGMHSFTLLIPELEVGLVVLTNTDPGGSALHGALVNTVLDKYLKLEEIDWIERTAEGYDQGQSAEDSVMTRVWERVEAANDAHISAENYIGMYKDNWFGTVEVAEKEGQLWFTSHRSPQLNGPMRYYQANTFAIHWEYQDMNADAFAMFYLDENGQAQSIRMKGISPNIDFSFDFQDLELKRVENSASVPEEN